MTNTQQDASGKNSLKFNRHVRKKKSKRTFIILFAVWITVVIILLAAGFLCYRFLTSKPRSIETCTVPNISGIELSDAENLLEENGLTMRIVGSGAGTGEKDIVVWQSVQQGESLSYKETVEVWVERSADKMWCWTDTETTLERLSASDIEYAIEYVNTPIAASGLITDVEISGSDAVVYVNQTEQVRMPDLSGMIESEAAEELNKLGIAFVKNVDADSETDEGRVLAQYPQAGELLDTGDTALMTVCIGQVKLPVFDMKIHGEAERSLTIGQSAILSVNISPDAAVLNEVQWESSEPSVASVEPTGKVTAVGEGSAVISACSEDGSHSAEFTVNVSDVIAGIEIIEIPKTEWLVGDEFSTQGLRIVAKSVGGKIIDVSDKCIVSGADLSRERTSTVTVGFSEGERTMCASFDILCSEASLELDTTDVILGLKDRHTLRPTYSPAYANVTYSSSDESIATVSEDGVITGVKAGKCTVTVDIEGKIVRQCSVSVKKKVVYLTFDDGPNAYTNDILNCLDRYNIKATFFCVGNSRYKKVYTRIADEGHSIGLHSYTHTYSKCYASADAFMKETEKLQNLVYECTGQRPMIVRFPGGTGNTVAKREVMLEIIDRLNKKGYSYFDWNSHSNDTIKGITAEEVAKRVLGSCYDNMEIVLMHNYAFTCDALDIIVPALERRGYTFKSITLDTPPLHEKVRGK